MNFSDFYRVIPKEIKLKIENLSNLLKEIIPQQSQTLAEAIEDAILPGGKRIRPLFLYLMYYLRGNQTITDKLERCALVLELMHTATLVHDDIIDNSSMRRGKPTVNVKHGVPRSILCGDYLLTKAFGVCSDLPYVIRKYTEECAVNLIAGENDELDQSPDAPLENIIRILTLKTASMFSLASKCASFLSNDEDRLIQLSSAFGTACGQAFQILDDLFDFLGSEDETGKPRLIDLAERKPTTVTHFWAQSGTPLSLEYIKKFNAERLELYAEDVLSSGAITKTIELLRKKIQEARKLCLVLNKNPSVYEVFEVFLNCFDKQPAIQAYV